MKRPFAVLVVLFLAACLFVGNQAHSQSCTPGSYEDCQPWEDACGGCFQYGTASPECYAAWCAPADACWRGYWLDYSWHVRIGHGCTVNYSSYCRGFNWWDAYNVSGGVEDQLWEHRSCWYGGPGFDVMYPATWSYPSKCYVESNRYCFPLTTANFCKMDTCEGW